MTAPSDSVSTTAAIAPRAHPRPAPHRSPLDVIRPNSWAHRLLLALGVVGAIAFNLTYIVDGALRPGYDALRQPMSALALGPGGTVQTLNFVVFGLVGCLTAPAWRASLTPATGATWYPRLKVLAGLAMIAAAGFPQDPAGYPLGVAAPAHPTAHAQVHQLVSVVSLTLTVAELAVLAQRLRHEPGWRGWGVACLLAAAGMMGLLAVFGALMATGGDGGLFEKLASATPTLLGLAVVTRLLARGDARFSSARP